MFNPKQLTQQLSVSEQISASDIPDLVKAGFKSIICNRPDGEGWLQPGFADIEAAATKAGLKVSYQPVVSGSITPEDATRFKALLNELPGPVLAYCRSGARCTMLSNLAQQSEGSA